MYLSWHLQASPRRTLCSFPTFLALQLSHTQARELLGLTSPQKSRDRVFVSIRYEMIV